MKTITFASHVAYLDPMTGEGLLVLPRPEDDIRDDIDGTAALPSVLSMQEADWGSVIASLDAMGWEPTANEDDGGVWHNGFTADGREVIGLYCREPIITMAGFDERADAYEALAALAGLAPLP